MVNDGKGTSVFENNVFVKLPGNIFLENPNLVEHHHCALCGTTHQTAATIQLAFNAAPPSLAAFGGHGGVEEPS